MNAKHHELAAPLPHPAPDQSAQPRPQNQSPGKPGPSGWKSAIVLIILLAAAAGVVWLVLHRMHEKANGPGGKNAKAKPPPVPVVPVVATRDVPLYLDGLGTVQAFNTVVVRARVDGQLVKVAFTEGQEVKAGDLLAQVDPAPYQAQFDQASAKKAQDEAQAANARVDLKRYAELLATESTTQQTYDTQKSLIAQLEATVKADQAAVDSARVQLDYATIRSPIDGRVGIRQVDQGNIVHANDANGLVSITQVRPISVVFTLPERTLPRIREQGPDLTVLAVSRENTNVLAEGKLAVIDNLIDTATGTIKMKGTFPNTNLRLWPGQFVNTRLHLTTRTNGVVVPASVVQRGPEGAFAFVIGQSNTVSMRALKVAQIEAGEALIDDGLKAGERVVVDGQYKLQPGSQVNTNTSTNTPANANAGSTNAASGERRAKTSPEKKP